MELRDLEFRVETLDDCKLIVIVWPTRLETSRLPASIAHYYSLWDDGERTALLSDLTRLSNLDGELYGILTTVLNRVKFQPGFVGGAWFTGQNLAIGEVVRRALSDVGRSPDAVHVTREAAVAYLRRIIAERVDGPAG